MSLSETEKLGAGLVECPWLGWFRSEDMEAVSEASSDTKCKYLPMDIFLFLLEYAIVSIVPNKKWE
jgi:hypothetical protein